MSHEVPLQPDIFTGELVDTRTAQQKRADERAARRAEREASLPPPLFTGRETIQFGVLKATPAHAFAPITELIFHIPPDTRSDEEKAAEAQRQAEALTPPLFPHELEDVMFHIDEDKIIYEYAQVMRLPFHVV